MDTEPSIRNAFTWGLASDAVEVEVADAGTVSAYLEKPLELQVVKEAIRQGIERRDLDCA